MSIPKRIKRDSKNKFSNLDIENFEIEELNDLDVEKSYKNVDLDIENFEVETNSDNKINDDELKKDKVVETIKSAMGTMFSPEQEKVIKHFGKPLNVLSCAGSGKSTVLIAKSNFMEMYYNVNPLSMLMITFNTEASKELEGRYLKSRKKLGLNMATLPTFKTFHALFYMLLKTVPKYKSVNVVSEGKYTYKLMGKINSVSEDKKDVLKEILNYRSQLINKGLSPDGIKNVNEVESSMFNYDTYISVVSEYVKLKRENKEIDFDDMMIKLYEEIENGNDSFVKKFQKTFKYVSVDEYQDISGVQKKLMDILIPDFNKFTAIGDDDQSSVTCFSISA